MRPAKINAMDLPLLFRPALKLNAVNPAIDNQTLSLDSGYASRVVTRMFQDADL